MGKWDQGEYNRVCNDKFKRLFYVSKSKGSLEYDTEVEKDWKIFIKTLDVEKKAVQSCFTSLIGAKQRYDPGRLENQPRAGPSIHVPRAHRHYDTSDTRHVSRPTIPLDSTQASLHTMTNLQGLGSQSAAQLRRMNNFGMRQNGEEAAGAGPGFEIVPPPRRDPLLRALLPPNTRVDRNRINIEPSFTMPVFPAHVPPSPGELAQRAINEQSARDEEDRQNYYEDMMPYSEYVTGRLPTPEIYQPGSLLDGLVYRPYSPQPLANNDAGTPVSLSGAARGMWGPNASDPMVRRRPISPSDRSDSRESGPLDHEATYPLFAPLDDAGPYPGEGFLDMFENGADDSDAEDDDDDEDVDLPGVSYTLRDGLTHWSPPTTFVEPSLQREPGSLPYEPYYRQRARQAVDAQVAVDQTSISNPSSTARPSPPAWADFHPPFPPPLQLRRRPREAYEESETGEEEGSDDRRVRPRTDEEMERSLPLPQTTAGGRFGGGERPQRPRRSMAADTHLNWGNDDRRNGLVFDAESYINPNL